MKKFFLILLLLCTIRVLLIAQGEAAEKNKSRRSLWGFNFGVNFSKFKEASDQSFPHFHSMDATLENNSRTGFQVGYLRDIHIAKGFSLLAEIDYNFVKHTIIYSEWIRSGYMGFITKGNYTMSISRIRLNFPLNIYFGDETRLNIFAGPCYEFPVSTSSKGLITKNEYNEISKVLISSSSMRDEEIQKGIESGLGGLIGFRMDIPSNKDYIAFEVRIGKSFYNIVEMPDLRESFVSFGLIYLLRVNK